MIADPRSGLVPVELDSTLPAEIRREILGAASFSYFASRVVFCEGEDQSLDKQFYAAWFRGRDTVVIPVGSCEAVRHCVQSLNRAKLIENLDATGIIDRDFRPEEFFARPAEGIVVIPVHEIEGLLCWPRLAERLARHLGKEITETEIASLVRSRITDEQVRRVVLERTRGRLLDQAQDIVQLKPRDWDERSLRAHLATLEMRLGTIGNATMIFDEELATVSAIRASGDVGEILRTFPSKPIAGSVAKQLGMSVEDLFALMGRALRTSDASDAMGVLGCDLAGILANLGLPQRSVRERTITVAAAN